MARNYTIYLKNETASGQNFWCFLEKPQGISDGGVFANSSTSLFVESGDMGVNEFVIPAQYTVGAGASNNAVDLNVQIDSSVTDIADLGQTWGAQYATVPPNRGPGLSLMQGQRIPDNSIGLVSNVFDKIRNESQRWFSNMSFGIQTQSGFIGFTWSPSPNNQNIITPQLVFYIATGSYSNSKLADFGAIASQAARIDLSNFIDFTVTVTLTNSGEWRVRGGRMV